VVIGDEEVVANLTPGHERGGLWWMGSKCRRPGDSSQYLYGLKTLAALGAHSPYLYTLAARGAHSPTILHLLQ
jgi:hypothetical protein